MDDMTYTKGQRVSYTDRKGTVYSGVVDVQRRGWVMIDLDEPCDTLQGWHASKMMLKASEVTEISEGGS